jgi:tetratricopeptide (TPR) repeat protein
MALGTATFASTALAGPEAKSDARAIDKARAQFQKGLALETAGDWAGALALFQQVALVKLTPQVRFHVGMCEEKLGQLGAALGDYELAAHEADQAGIAEVSAQVALRREELRARIPTVTIVRGQGAEYASISLDGVAIGAVSVGVKLPVDPGPHSIEARASGFKASRLNFELAEKESKTVELALERLPVDANIPELPGAARVAPNQEPEPGQANVLPFVIGGAGVVSLGASVVFFLLRQNAIKTLDSECTLPPPNTCPAQAKSTYDAGKTYSTLVNVTLGVGVVGIGAGTVLLLVQKRPKAVSIGLALGAQAAPVGATLVGSF